MQFGETEFYGSEKEIFGSFIIFIFNIIGGIQNGFYIFIVAFTPAAVAGDDRLLVAAEVGLPQVAVPFGLDMLSVGGRPKLLEPYEDRNR